MSTDDYLHEKLTADCMRKRGKLVDREYPHAWRGPAADYSDEEIRERGRSRIEREQKLNQFIP